MNYYEIFENRYIYAIKVVSKYKQNALISQQNMCYGIIYSTLKKLVILIFYDKLFYIN